jgi:predicted enzyme related to lactoylglutathione lyase
MSKPRIEIGIDCQNPQFLAPFWAAALGYGVGQLGPDGVYLVLEPPDAASPGVYLQRVPEPKEVKNRVHLDLYDPVPEQLISDLEAIGGNRLGLPRTTEEGSWWQVMADPEGNEFCICREQPRP